jgi:hypothetical protein
MENDAIIVVHGFLQLPNLQKLKVVEAMNDYFDSMEKDAIRAKHDSAFAGLDIDSIDCKCCDRKAIGV